MKIWTNPVFLRDIGWEYRKNLIWFITLRGLMIFFGIALLVLPPILGWIVTVQSSQKSAFVTTLFAFSAAVCVGLIFPAGKMGAKAFGIEFRLGQMEELALCGLTVKEIVQGKLAARWTPLVYIFLVASFWYFIAIVLTFADGDLDIEILPFHIFVALLIFAMMTQCVLEGFRTSTRKKSGLLSQAIVTIRFSILPVIFVGVVSGLFVWLIDQLSFEFMKDDSVAIIALYAFLTTFLLGKGLALKASYERAMEAANNLFENLYDQTSN